MKDTVMLTIIISVVSAIMGFLGGMIAEKIRNLYYDKGRRN